MSEGSNVAGFPCSPCINTTGNLFGSIGQPDPFEIECGEFETYIDFNTVCPDAWSWDCASDIDGKYFWLTDDLGRKYHVWYNDLTSNSVNPNPSGSSGGIQVDIKPSCSLNYSNLPPANDPDGELDFKSEFSPNLNLEHHPDGDFCGRCYQCLGRLCDDNYLASNPIFRIDRDGNGVRWCEVPPACTCENRFGGWPPRYGGIRKPCEDLYKLTNDAIKDIKDTSDALGEYDKVVGEFNKWITNNYGEIRGNFVGYDVNGNPIHIGSPFSNRTEEEVKCILTIKSGKSFRPGGNQQADAFDGNTGFDFGDGNVDDALGGLGNCCHNEKFTKPRLFIKIPTLDEHWGGSGMVDCDPNDPLCVCDATPLGLYGPDWDWGSNIWPWGGMGNYDGNNITNYGKSDYSLHEYQLNGPAEDFDCFGCNDFSLVSVTKAANADDGAISLPSAVKVCAGAPCRTRIGLILILPEEASFYNNPDDELGGSWETAKCMFEMEAREFERRANALSDSGVEFRIEIISPKGYSKLSTPYFSGDFYCGDNYRPAPVGSWVNCHDDYLFPPRFSASGGWQNVLSGCGGGGSMKHPCGGPTGQCGHWGKLLGDITGGGNLPSGINITYVDNCNEAVDQQDNGVCCTPPHVGVVDRRGQIVGGCPYRNDCVEPSPPKGTFSAWGCNGSPPHECFPGRNGFPGQCCFVSHTQSPPDGRYPQTGPWELGCHRVTGQDIKDAWDRLTQGDWLPHDFQLQWVLEQPSWDTLPGRGDGRPGMFQPSLLFAGGGAYGRFQWDHGGHTPGFLYSCTVNENVGLTVCDPADPMHGVPIQPSSGRTGWAPAPEVLVDVCTIADDWADAISQIYDDAIAMEENSPDIEDCAKTHSFTFGSVNPHEQFRWMGAINGKLGAFFRDCDIVEPEPSYNLELGHADHICTQHMKPRWAMAQLFDGDPNDFFDGYWKRGPDKTLNPLLGPVSWHVGEIHSGWGPVTKPKRSEVIGKWNIGSGEDFSNLPRHRIHKHAAFTTRIEFADLNQVIENPADFSACFCCECEYSQVDVDISTPNFGEECWAVHPNSGKAIEPALPIGGQVTLSSKNIGGCIFGTDDETLFWDHIHLDLNGRFVSEPHRPDPNNRFKALPAVIEKRAVLTLYHRGRPVMKYFSKDKIEEGSCPVHLELTKGVLNAAIPDEWGRGGGDWGKGIEVYGYGWNQDDMFITTPHTAYPNTDTRVNGGKINNLFHVCDPFSWQASDNAVARFAFHEDKHADLSSAKIKLTSTDGTTKSYTVRNDDSANASQNEFNAGETAYETAFNFAVAVTSISGHNGKIAVSLFEAPERDPLIHHHPGSAGNIFSYNSPAQAGGGPVIVELKQSVPGEEGNTDYKLISDFEKILDNRWTPENTPEICNENDPTAGFHTVGRWSRYNPSLCRFINGDGCPEPTVPTWEGKPESAPRPKTSQCLNFDHHPNSWTHSCPCKWLENAMPDTVMLTLT